MPVYADLVHQTSTSTGTGNLTVAAVNGKRSFNTAYGTGGTNTFDYYISHREAAEWERGTGHLSAATTFVRDTVIASSNANAAVNFAAGTKDITNDQPAGLRLDNTRTLTSGNGLSGGGNLTADRTLAVGAGTGITVNADDVALTVPVSIANGGNGTTTGISTATQTALDAKAASASLANYLPLAGGTLTGDLNANSSTAYQNIYIRGNTSPGIHLNPSSGATDDSWIFQEGNVLYITNNAGSGIAFQMDLPTAIATFTNSPLVPTAATADNTTKAANTNHVKANLANYLPLAGGTMTGTATFSGNVQIGNDYTTSKINIGTVGHYIGRNSADGRLQIGGGQALVEIVTVPLLLAGDPTIALHAATKQYTDTKLPLAGGTMTGPVGFAGLSTWQYAGVGAGAYYSTFDTVNRFFVGTDTGTDYFRIYTTGYGNALSVDGATGQVSCPVAPTSGNHVVNKTYADTKLSLTGGSLSGSLYVGTTLSAGTGIYGGLLQLDATDPNMYFKAPTGHGASAYTYVNNQPCWVDVRTAASWQILRYNSSTGAFIDYPLSIDNSTGVTLFGGKLKVENDANFGLQKNAGYNELRFDASYAWRQSGGNIYFAGPSGDNFWCGSSGDFVIRGATAYKVGAGSWTDSSDARIKTVEGEYPRGLNEIAALRPVYYTYKGNDTLKQPAKTGLDVVEDPDTKEELTVPYPNSPHYQVAVDETKFAGLVAQEVESIFPEMVSKRLGFIDGEPVTDMRDLNTSPLVFALINAVKELKAQNESLAVRIAILEGG